MAQAGGSWMESIMGRARFDPGYDNRRPLNAGRLVGAKRPFKVKQIWAIRFHLDHEQRLRDRALLDLAIDSKLRGCDLVKLKNGSLSRRRCRGCPDARGGRGDMRANTKAG